MRLPTFIFLFCTIFLTLYTCRGENTVYNPKSKWPAIVISVVIQNDIGMLPYFLSCLHRLEYPKHRLYIRIHSDYNEDNSIEIIEEWKKNFGKDYNGVYISIDRDSGKLLKDQHNSAHWSPERFRHVIQLRENALDFAKKKWADYIFMLDADIFLTDPETLKSLVHKDYLVVAPMLLSDGMYSNFWAGMTKSYFYKRTENYEQILNRSKLGCFQVPMVHSAVLISLKSQPSDILTYDPSKMKNYDGPEDDIIAFAVNSQNNGVNLTVCNDRVYGFIPIPVEDKDNFTSEHDQVLNVKMEALGRGVSLPLNANFTRYVSYPKKWKYGTSEIFVINLERRIERKKLMEQSFLELGMDVTLFKAIDGKKLNFKDLKDLGVTLLPHYEDPYHRRCKATIRKVDSGPRAPDRDATGNIAEMMTVVFKLTKSCANQISKKHLEVTLVLEDDIHFVPYFRHRFLQLLEEIKTLDWDLVYIGRKILLDGKEEYVTNHTTRPLYSYWTLGYLLSEKGARKLIMAEPLSKMVPVDEFLPIMFDQHPNDTWKSFFPNRTLKAFSASPLLVHPTHYTGDDGYISDTEDSTVVPLTPITRASARQEAVRASATEEARNEL